MKRIWIGAALLAGALIFGIWAANYQNRCHSPGSLELRQAAQLARDGDWEGALKLENSARERWRGCRKLTAVMTEQAPFAQAERLFAQLEIYGQARDPVSFGAVAAELAMALEDLAQAQRIDWWNLL